FIDVYVKEKMVFLAMKLQPNKQVRDIQPVKMTYKATKPMIPLRLTAVAATPNMVVLTWILEKAQAEPEDYAAVSVPASVAGFTASLPDVSNVHDLSKGPNRVWDCDKMTNTVTNPLVATASRATDNFNPVVTAICAAGACIALALVFVGFGLVVSRRRA